MRIRMAMLTIPLPSFSRACPPVTPVSDSPPPIVRVYRTPVLRNRESGRLDSGDTGEGWFVEARNERGRTQGDSTGGRTDGNFGTLDDVRYE